MSVIIFLIILAVLVLVHEFGHFIVAKKSGIRVDEFGLGFPPKLFSWKPKKSETTYSINLIPFGGFVKIFGENPDEESLKGADSTRSIARKNRAIQVAVLAAGVVFNVIFAWIIISLATMVGLPMSVSERYAKDVRDAHVIITNTAPGSPAEKAGIEAGDSLVYLEAGPRNLQGESITTQGIQEFIQANENEQIGFLAKRPNGETFFATMKPEAGIAEGKKVVGISMDTVGTLKLGFFRAWYEGAIITYDMTIATAVGLWSFLSQAVIGQADFTQVSGPVGIAGIVSTARDLGFVYLLSFTAIISLNLAIINLFPFPALDGGRILFVVIEAIRRKSLNPRVLNIIHAAGFFILIALMLVVTYKDIAKLFAK